MKEMQEMCAKKYMEYKRFIVWVIVVGYLIYGILTPVDFFAENTVVISAIMVRAVLIIPLVLFLLAVRIIKDYRICSILVIGIIYIISKIVKISYEYTVGEYACFAGYICAYFFLLISTFGIPVFMTCIAQIINIVILSVSVYQASDIFEQNKLVIQMSIQIFIVQASILWFILAVNIEKKNIKSYKEQQEIEWMRFHDQLTGAYNRFILQELLKKKESTKNKVILMIDIDHFKKVNDTFGHDYGDIVLKKVASLIIENAKMQDYVIRWGGEEFVVILDMENKDDGGAIAERIRKSVEENTKNTECPVTISIGVAAHIEGKIADTIQRADKKAYQAKQNGRNMVCMSL